MRVHVWRACVQACVHAPSTNIYFFSIGKVNSTGFSLDGMGSSCVRFGFEPGRVISTEATRRLSLERRRPSFSIDNRIKPGEAGDLRQGQAHPWQGPAIELLSDGRS